MQVVVGRDLGRCFVVGRGGAQVVAQLWSRNRRTTAGGLMITKAWLQVSGRESAVLKTWLWGIDDLEGVATRVARRRGVDDLEGVATGV